MYVFVSLKKGNITPFIYKIETQNQKKKIFLFRIINVCVCVLYLLRSETTLPYQAILSSLSSNLFLKITVYI